jgi:polysaccharide pyruvyl transferase WcaK-like protein
MTKLKVGILTFHRCINYGSYWQARSLAEGIKAFGHDVEILDHYSGSVNISEWKCALQPTLPTPVPSADKKLYRQKVEKFFQAFEKLPLSRPFPLDNPRQMDDYNIVITGSDEVWNLFHPWYKNYSTFFFGDELRADKLISYAASFGNYSAWWGLEQYWSKKLYQFSSISVRDENARALVHHTTGIQPAVVLDPCLQFTSDAKKLKSNTDKKAVIVYGHNFSHSFIKKMQKWAKKAGRKLVSIGYRNDWADEQWLTAGPEDFELAMLNAEAIVTNFFHGCVFALRNEKPFACETSEYRSIKVPDLLNQTGSENHLINEFTKDAEINKMLSDPLNSNILQNIKDLRKNSTDFLIHALGNKEEYARLD